MDAQWKVKNLEENKKVESKTFTSNDKPWRLVMSNRCNKTYLALEYLGGSYQDLHTRFTFIVNNNKFEGMYDFSLFNNNMGIYLENSDEYTVFVDITVNTKPHDSRSETGYVGLRNLGATCYINSLMQTLFNIKKFRNDVFQLKPDGRILTLQKLFFNMQESAHAVDTTDFVISNVWVDNVNVHQDIHEFSKVFFDSLEKDSKNKEFIENLIQGEITTYIKGKCGCNRRIKEKFQDIQVEIRDFFNNKLSSNLEESLKLYIKPEVLEGNNKYRCDKHGLTDAEKGSIFAELPPVMFMLLKRFNMDYETGEGYKINDYFEFQKEIDMGKYCEDDGENMYDLYSVIVHRGGHDEGHFYSYINLNGKWLKFNDSVVSEVSINEALENNFGGRHPYHDRSRDYSAYYLVYTKREMKTKLFDEKINIPLKTLEKIEKAPAKITLSCFTTDNIRNYRGLGFYNIDSYDYPLTSYINFEVREGDNIKILKNKINQRINTRKKIFLFECKKDKEIIKLDTEVLNVIKNTSQVQPVNFINEISKEINHLNDNKKINEVSYGLCGAGEQDINTTVVIPKATVEYIDESTINTEASYFVYATHKPADFKTDKLIFLKVYSNESWCENTFPLSLRLASVMHVRGTIKENLELFSEKTGVETPLIFKETNFLRPLDHTQNIKDLENGEVLIVVNSKYITEFVTFMIAFTQRICLNVNCGVHNFTIFLPKFLNSSQVEGEIQKFAGSKAIYLRSDPNSESNDFKSANEEFNQSEQESDAYSQHVSKNSVMCGIEPNYHLIYLAFCNKEIDYNSISHLHVFVVPKNSVVQDLIKSIMVSNHVCLSPMQAHPLKNLRVVDTVKDSLYLKSFELNEQFTSNGMCIVQPFGEKVIKTAYYTGMYKIIGFPFFLQTEAKTIGELRSAYHIFEKIVKFNGKNYEELEMDESLEEFNNECYLLIERKIFR